MKVNTPDITHVPARKLGKMVEVRRINAAVGHDYRTVARNTDGNDDLMAMVAAVADETATLRELLSHTMFGLQTEQTRTTELLGEILNELRKTREVSHER